MENDLRFPNSNGKHLVKDYWEVLDVNARKLSYGSYGNEGRYADHSVHTKNEFNNFKILMKKPGKRFRKY